MEALGGTAKLIHIRDLPTHWTLVRCPFREPGRDRLPNFVAYATKFGSAWFLVPMRGKMDVEPTLEPEEGSARHSVRAIAAFPPAWRSEKRCSSHAHSRRFATTGCFQNSRSV